MPFGGLLTAGLVGGGALLGGISGAVNTRPPSLDKVQKNALHSLIGSLLPTATGNPTIDPIQQALMYGQIAQGRSGADTAVTHALSSRGLGTSGLLGAGLLQNQNTASTNQNTANLSLQQQAIQQKNIAAQDILGLLGVSNIPGQSTAGGFLAGLSPVLAYSIQNMLNSNPGGFTSPTASLSPYGGNINSQLGALYAES